MRKFISLISLFLSFSLIAQDISMPKSEWLSNLEPILIPHLCAEQSPFLKGYKGNDCEKDVKKLFVKCTTQVDNVILPDPVNSVAQANKGGQVISECINAYYHGGQLLQIFNMIQKMDK